MSFGPWPPHRFVNCWSSQPRREMARQSALFPFQSLGSDIIGFYKRYQMLARLAFRVFIGALNLVAIHAAQTIVTLPTLPTP